VFKNIAVRNFVDHPSVVDLGQPLYVNLFRKIRILERSVPVRFGLCDLFSLGYKVSFFKRKKGFADHNIGLLLPANSELLSRDTVS
jgi:hypothetical protein